MKNQFLNKKIVLVSILSLSLISTVFNQDAYSADTEIEEYSVEDHPSSEADSMDEIRADDFFNEVDEDFTNGEAIQIPQQDSSPVPQPSNSTPSVPPSKGKELGLNHFPGLLTEDDRSLEEVCGFPSVKKMAMDRILQKKKKYLTGETSNKKVLIALRDQTINIFANNLLQRVMGGFINIAGLGFEWMGGKPPFSTVDNFVTWGKIDKKDANGKTIVDAAGNTIRETLHPLSWTINKLFSSNNTGSRAEDFAAAMTAREASSAILTAWRESKLTQVEGLKQVHEELMRESKKDVEELDPDFQEKIQLLDERIAQDLSNQQADLALKKMIRREEVYLNLPHPGDIMNIAQYGKYGNEACRKRIDNNVNELINSYPDENHEVLKVVIQQIRSNAILKHTSPVQAYLYGPPGTGKTTFVQRLGKALHLYVCEINLSNLESQELLGPEQPDDWVSLDDFKALGKIGDCLRKATHRNIIVFFDEAGPVVSSGGSSRGGGYDYNSMKKQMLQEQFKKILDPSNQEIMLNALGIKLPVDRVTYLMAGNSPISNSALATRLPQIVFRRLGVVEKRNAINVEFEKVITDLRDVFNEDEVNRIESIGREYSDFILQEDEKLNPGARVIKLVTQEFLNYLRILVLDEQLTGSSLITDERLKRFIVDSFQRRVPGKEF